MRKPASRSPLKASPLRNPGQGLDERIERTVNDQAMPWIVMALVAILLAVLEWWRWFSNAPPRPLAYTLVAVFFGGLAAWRIVGYRREIQNLKLGRDGEKAVGQLLDTYREAGYRVFHDIPGEDFNIDHVIIGPTGVFTIETKTWSKPARGRPVIEVDGERLLKNGHPVDRDPIIQVKAQARWLGELLRESTGKDFPVRPVLVFPGWFIENAPQRDIWILNPKGLRKFLDNARESLSPEDMGLASYHLSRYIRSVASESNRSGR